MKVAELRLYELVKIAKRNKLDNIETVSLIKSYYSDYIIDPRDLEIIINFALCLVAVYMIFEVIA